MKKNITPLLTSITTLVLLLSGCATTGIAKNKKIITASQLTYTESSKPNSIPVEYRDIINPYDDTLTFPDEINQQQLQEDLNEFCYLFETVCIGYEEAKENGYDSADFKKTISETLKNKTSIKRSELVTEIKKYLTGKLIDNHFEIITSESFDKVVSKSIVYYSNTYFKKSGDEYFVCSTDNPEIKEGQKFTGKDECLLYYPSKGSDVYRAACFDTDKRETMEISVNDKSYTLAVRAEVPIDVRQTLRFNEKDTEDTAYLSLSHFHTTGVNDKYRAGTDDNLMRFMKAGRECQNKKNVILDIRSNGGGVNDYVKSFLGLLYIPQELIDTENYENNLGPNVEYMNLLKPLFDLYRYQRSPAYLQATLFDLVFLGDSTEDTEKYLSSMKENPRIDYYNGQEEFPLVTWNKMIPEGGAFKGKLIIITDRNSASCSEETCLYSKQLFGDNAILVGENTMGCISYGDVRFYKLKNSGITIQLSAEDCRKAFETCSNWKGETKGLYPDVWSLGEDLLDTLVILTGDDKLRDKIPYIEMNLQ